MKKLIFLGSTITSFLTPLQVLAADIEIKAPTQGGKAVGYSDLGAFITNVVTIVFIFAIIAVLFMLIWGAFEWITSGGDKESVGKARGRIINALIGIAVLAVAFAIFKVAGQFLGFDPFNFDIPRPPTQNNP